MKNQPVALILEQRKAVPSGEKTEAMFEMKTKERTIGPRYRAQSVKELYPVGTYINRMILTNKWNGSDAICSFSLDLAGNRDDRLKHLMSVTAIIRI